MADSAVEAPDPEFGIGYSGFSASDSGCGSSDSVPGDGTDEAFSRGAGVGNGRGTAPLEAHPPARALPSTMSKAIGTRSTISGDCVTVSTLLTIGRVRRFRSSFDAAGAVKPLSQCEQWLYMIARLDRIIARRAK